MKVGDKVEMRHGPFVSTWEVSEIIEAGARLRYLDDVQFVGYQDPMNAPNGAELTNNTEDSFIGRAHWAAHEEN